MKTKSELAVRASRLALALSLLSTCDFQLSILAQGTAFTYQGRLSNSGGPASGIYDLRFCIYSALTNGNTLGAPLTNSATAISNGLFTVMLDFGPGIFSGPDRWLEIGVRTNGSSAAYAILAPRQRLTATPYALMANTASALQGTLTFTNGGTGQSSYAPGDVLYAGAANSLARLSVGASGQTLTVSNGVPAWMAANAHNHFGQSWSGAAGGTDGLNVRNTANVDGSSALTGLATSTSALNYGVFGQTSSSNGIGVQGLALALGGFPIGVVGQTVSSNGCGVYGLASALGGPPAGVYGEAASTNGIGVYGLGSAPTGVPVGVYGETTAPLGYGLYTPNRLFVGDLAFFESSVALYSSARLFLDVGTTAQPASTFLSSPDVGLFSPATNVFGIATAGAERLRIDASGRLGLGRVPATNLLEVAGEASKATAGNWFANSDARIKTDVHTLTNALGIIERLRPVSFRYSEAYRQAHPGIRAQPYYNVVAQEFAQVFPDSVKESGEKMDGQEILQADTYPAAIYCIAAIQELHHLMQTRDAALEQLKRAQAELEELQQRQAALEERLQALEARGGLARQP